MQFKMNGRTFTIKKVSKNEMWGDAGEAKKPDKDYLGKLNAYTQEIWLSEDLSPEQEIITLIHELTHCYIWSYGISCDSYNEEDICDINANSHIIINEILKQYLKEDR